MRGLWAIVAVSGVALLAGCAGRAAREPVVPATGGSARPAVSLAGEWQLDLRASGRAAMPGGVASMGGVRGGFDGGGGRSGGMPQGRMPTPAARDSLLRRDSLARDSVMAEFGRLVIGQADSALTFAQGRRPPLVVYTDWRETRIPGRHGPNDVTFVTGQWVGTRFDVRRVLPSRTVVVERFELSRDGRRLLVTTRVVERGHERGEILPREGTKVYNRASAAP
jgi:hypothetical protein